LNIKNWANDIKGSIPAPYNDTQEKGKNQLIQNPKYIIIKLSLFNINMNQILYFLIVISIAIYLAFIWIPKSINSTLFMAGDILMGFVLVSILLNNNYNILVIISLIWLIGNYLVGCKLGTKSILGPFGPCKWDVYNGFTIATLLPLVLV